MSKNKTGWVVPLKPGETEEQRMNEVMNAFFVSCPAPEKEIKRAKKFASFIDRIAKDKT